MDPSDAEFLKETMEVIDSKKDVLHSILDANNRVYSHHEPLINLLQGRLNLDVEMEDTDMGPIDPSVTINNISLGGEGAMIETLQPAFRTELGEDVT